MKKLMFVLILFIGTTSVFSEVDEDCLVVPFNDVLEDYTYYDEFFGDEHYNTNPSGIRLDTCNSIPGNWIYYGNFFQIVFDINIFPRDTVYESTVENPAPSLDLYSDDLPIQYNYLKPKLDSLQIIFGDYKFIDYLTSIPDTTLLSPKRKLLLLFESYSKLDSVFNYIMALDFVDTLMWKMPSSITSVFLHKKQKMKIYPNPVSDFLSLEFSEGVQTVSIIDIMGIEIKEIESANIEQVDVSDLATGTYFMIINNKYIHKFIKE